MPSMPSEPVEADLIDRLVRYGLGQGEARCYVAMLAPRAFKVGEVAHKTGLPRSRSYELIRSLVRSGLCSEVAGGRVARFRAAPPNEAIGRLESFLAEQERRRTAALATIMGALEAREAGAAAGVGDEPVQTLRRADQVFAAYDRLLDVTRDEVVSAVAMPWTPVLRASQRQRIDSGVRLRALHERAIYGSRTHHEFVGRFARLGVDTRVVDKVSAQFSVFDRRLGILHLSRPRMGSRLHESLLINHAGLAQTLHQAFECLWERANPLEDALRRGTGPGHSDPGTEPRAGARPAPRGGDGRFVGYD
jgi:sugar-specific transcriptional regulator TrmB